MGEDAILTIKDIANMPEGMFTCFTEKMLLMREPTTQVLVGRTIQ